MNSNLAHSNSETPYLIQVNIKNLSKDTKQVILFNALEDLLDTTNACAITVNGEEHREFKAAMLINSFLLYNTKVVCSDVKQFNNVWVVERKNAIGECYSDLISLNEKRSPHNNNNAINFDYQINCDGKVGIRFS